MATQRKLTAGPSKYDLMMSLLEGKPVTFTIEGIGTQETQVTLLQSEDGSHESWNIQGVLTQCDWQRFKGYFNTRTRRGFIKSDFEDSKEDSTPTERKPKVGDRAYTKYHGQKFEGVIVHINEHGRGALEPADPNIDWGYHKGDNCIIGDEQRPFRGLFFGYDEKVVWDAEADMWYTPADWD